MLMMKKEEEEEEEGVIKPCSKREKEGEREGEGL